MQPAPMPMPPMGGGPMGGGPMGGPVPIAPQRGIGPIPQAVPSYLQNRGQGARAGRPLEPWKDSLRLMMFIWGGVLLLAFLTPVGITPLRFQWDLIIDGEGIGSKLPPLLIASVGLLSIVLALIPMSPSPRGLIGGLLGLTGVLVPMLLVLSKSDFDLGQILFLVYFLGMIMLIPGLLIRHEYRDSIMPRILVTVGVLMVLVPLLIPQHDKMPLVEMFTQIIDAEGKSKVAAIVNLGPVVFAVLSLLVWLPSPSSAGAKVYAWLIIGWPAVELLTGLLLTGHIGSAVEGSPYGALMSWAPESSYMVLIGYGLATVLGKQLE